MKLLIAVDMEGISGVVNWDQVNPAHAEYSRFRKIMTDDVNAAIEGAFAGGADEVVVADGHNAGYNILLEQLDRRARLNAGNNAPFVMVQGVDSGIDAAIFVGYHGRAGHPLAVLTHTWDLHVMNVWLNDILVGETGLNAAVCGHFGAPLLMVTGDQGLAEEAGALIPGIETVVVKRAAGYFAAECLTPKTAQEQIRLGAEKAVRAYRQGQSSQPFTLQYPLTLTVEFSTSAWADSAMRLPGAERLDGRKVRVEATDMPVAYRVFRTMVEHNGNG